MGGAGLERPATPIPAPGICTEVRIIRDTFKRYRAVYIAIVNERVRVDQRDDPRALTDALPNSAAELPLLCAKLMWR